MSNFPSLQPAMTVMVAIDHPIRIGKSLTGPTGPFASPRLTAPQAPPPEAPPSTSQCAPFPHPPSPSTDQPPTKPMTDITIKSEPGFTPEIDAKLHGTANDYIHNDPDNKHMRLNAHGQVKDKSGGLLHLTYTGVVAITPALGAILTGQDDAKSTEFGDSFIEMHFETGDEKLKALELGMFVGAGRFIVEKGKPVTVEYKLSKVGKGQ